MSLNLFLTAIIFLNCSNLDQTSSYCPENDDDFFMIGCNPDDLFLSDTTNISQCINVSELSADTNQYDNYINIENFDCSNYNSQTKTISNQPQDFIQDSNKIFLPYNDFQSDINDNFLYSYNQTATNMDSPSNNVQYSTASSQNLELNANLNNPCTSNQSMNISYQLNTGEKAVVYCDFYDNNSNSKINLQNGTIQSFYPNDYSNSCETDNRLSYKQLVTQAHINFLENIIEDINAECDRLSHDDLKKAFLLLFLSDFTQFFEEIKKYTSKNHKNLEYASAGKVDKSNKFAKNSQISEETRLFLNILGSLNPTDGYDGSSTEYHQKIFSHIDLRIRNKSLVQNDDYQDSESLQGLEKNSKRKEINENEDLDKLDGELHIRKKNP